MAGKSRARSRQLAQRQAEARIIAQSVEIIGILIAARDRQHTGKEDILKSMDHPRRIARVRNTCRKLLADAHHALGLSQQQHTAIRGQPAAVKRSCDLLAANRWIRKYSRAIIASGGCGLWHFLSLKSVRIRHPVPNSDQSLTPLPPTLQTNAGE